jgi:NCAIR mutase (PurE)-related protein
MDETTLRKLLRDVRAGRLAEGAALERLRTLPFEDLGFARVDHHRALRRGLPEVVFGARKTPAQAVEIVRALARGSKAPVLVTRVDAAMRDALVRAFPRAQVHEAARAVTLGRLPAGKGLVAVVSAGTSDGSVAAEAALAARFGGARVTTFEDVGVAGLHRLISILPTVRKARAIVVVAGMEGALPSVVAGLVAAPVIAVPTSVGYGAAFGGIAALLAMLNSCSSGVSVVNIDNGFGAGVQAAMINRR